MTVRRALAVAAAALAAALAGCGGGPAPADEILSETAARLGDIRSGRISVRMLLEPRDGSAGGRVGFALDGPVDLRGRPLPIARLRYTQIAGERQGGATFVSTGREAYVEAAGAAYRLPAAQVAELARGTVGLQRPGALRQLPVDGWIRDAESHAGGRVGGVDTERVTARLDAARAVRGIFAAARRFGGTSAPEVGDAGEETLRRAVESARLELWSGREDRLLRRMALAVVFRASVPRALREELGALVGVRLTLAVAVGDPNEPVRVRPPVNPRPASELPGAGS